MAKNMHNNKVDLSILELESDLIFHPAKATTLKNDSKSPSPPLPPSQAPITLENVSKTKTANIITVNMKGEKAKLGLVGKKNSNHKGCCTKIFLVLRNRKHPKFIPLLIAIVLLSFLLIAIIVVPIIVIVLSDSNRSNANYNQVTNLTSSSTVTMITTSIPLVNVVLSNLVEINEIPIGPIGPNGSNFIQDVIFVFNLYNIYPGYLICVLKQMFKFLNKVGKNSQKLMNKHLFFTFLVWIIDQFYHFYSNLFLNKVLQLAKKCNKSSSGQCNMGKKVILNDLERHLKKFIFF